MNVSFPRYMPAEASALNRTLRQLYADEHGTYSGGATSADARLGRPGHIMYSNEPPLEQGLSDEDSFGFAFTQGKGVMVSICYSFCAAVLQKNTVSCEWNIVYDIY